MPTTAPHLTQRTHCLTRPYSFISITFAGSPLHAPPSRLRHNPLLRFLVWCVNMKNGQRNDMRVLSMRNAQPVVVNAGREIPWSGGYKTAVWRRIQLVLAADRSSVSASA